jgi:hypothetical protein
MPKPSPEDEWKLTVNAQYQEAMKVAINLATASLVLPIVFLKVFVGADKFSSAGPPASAYSSWVLLLVSVLSGMGFYYASAKFVKAVCGGYDERSDKEEKKYELIRDITAVVVAVCFFAGIVSLLVFFLTLVAPGATC